MAKKRLDDTLISKKLASHSQEAFIATLEGRVFVNGQKMILPAQLVDPDAKIELRAGPHYVGRGALKLEAAIQKFGISVKNKICADIGAATGGFTEILLKYGAQRVYAIDTARGKIALKLREDPRVTVMEQTDVRKLKILPESINLAVVDVSLLSLRQILPAAARFLAPNGAIIALFKPQYETRDPKLLKKGVIRDADTRRKLLDEFLIWARENGWKIKSMMESPIRGTSGNTEYLLYFRPLD